MQPGHTDLCIGHCHAPLGRSDIGSLFEEFRWHSKRDGRQCGNKLRNGKPEFRSRFSDQGGHGVFHLRSLQTEINRLSLSTFKLGFRMQNIQRLARATEAVDFDVAGREKKNSVPFPGSDINHRLQTAYAYLHT